MLQHLRRVLLALLAVAGLCTSLALVVEPATASTSHHTSRAHHHRHHHKHHHRRHHHKRTLHRRSHRPTRHVAAVRPAQVAKAAQVTSSAPKASTMAAGTSSTTQTPSRRVLIGEYSGSNFPTDIDSYVASAGVKPDIVMWYSSWGKPLFWTRALDGVAARNAIPLITWSPDVGAPFSMSGLAAGQYDAYITAQALAAKADGRTMYVRPFHEMNGTWEPSYGYGHITASQFVAGWQHVVQIFRNVGATNVKWVWSPNIYGAGPSTAPFDQYFPGNDYVDWVGLDGYNRPAYWSSFAKLYQRSYDDITHLTSKTVIIAEWGCSEAGGDKAAWIHDAFSTIHTSMPRIRAVISFDRDKEQDWRVNSSAASLAAYKSGMTMLTGS